MARYEEISIDQGADIAIELRLTEVDGSKKNLNGYSVASKMKKSYNSDSDDTQAFTAIVSNASDGYVTLSLTNEETDALDASKYLFDVELSHDDSDGNTIIERILEGIIVVNPSVTR